MAAANVGAIATGTPANGNTAPSDDPDVQPGEVGSLNVAGISTNILWVRLGMVTVFTQEQLNGDVNITRLGDIAGTTDVS